MGTPGCASTCCRVSMGEHRLSSQQQLVTGTAPWPAPPPCLARHQDLGIPGSQPGERTPPISSGLCA